MYVPRGLLRVNAEGTTVDMSHLYWGSPGMKEEIQNFFKKHGYAEAERLPYERHENCLIVKFPTPEAVACGWHWAEDVDGLPF